ncbi:hypothetical protein [Agrobacterium pusense]
MRRYGCEAAGVFGCDCHGFSFSAASTRAAQTSRAFCG